MRLFVSLLVWVLRAVFTSRYPLALENLALRQQLAAFIRTQKRPLWLARWSSEELDSRR